MITSRPITWKNDMRTPKVMRTAGWSIRSAIAVCISFSCVFSQKESDGILGKWLTQDKDAVFEFYRVAGEYRARLAPIKCPDLKDTKNPVDSLRGRSLDGATIVYGLIFNEAKKQWVDGWVYNPEDGGNYHCYCWLNANGAELLFRGYLGVKLLGKTQIWKKVVPGGGGNHR